MKLLSIHLPSNKPLHFRRLVKNLVATAADPKCFEVVVKIDVGDGAMERAIEEIRRDIDVNMTVVHTPPFPSYWHTYIAFNECLRASDPEYYFCWHVNDEVLIETRDWDRRLESYIDFFPDRIYRLKVNPHKMFRNFSDIHETCLYADYPIVPRRWLEGTEVWAECHGPDVYQEGIAIYLGRYGHHRNVPLLDFVVGGDEPGENLSPEKTLARSQGTCNAWDSILSSNMQERMARSARRLQLLILAHEYKVANYEIREDARTKTLELVDIEYERVRARVWYTIDHVAVRLRNFHYIARRDLPHSLFGKSLVYRGALRAYAAVLPTSRAIVVLFKLPLGLLMGIPWTAMRAATVQACPAFERLFNAPHAVLRRLRGMA